ncbi:MAG: ribosome small subunit-dependent GTPase A [Bdellovibrionota bacterium]
MTNSHEEFLRLFGWNSSLLSHSPSPVSDFLIPARVICEERNLYRLQTGLQSFLWSSVAGKLQFNARGRMDYPAVGDWVWVQSPHSSDRGIIQEICPRKTVLYRNQVASNAEKQILASNVDTVFVTTSVNDDLNIRRLERYLAVALEANTSPVILLTKADTCPEKIDEAMSDLEREFPGIPAYSLSQETFSYADFLGGYLTKGSTSVFIGSSGVGKSTLVNYLIGKEEIKTQAVRESDGRGRHTTTSRNLYVSRYGGLIIDTPGMRELQLADHEEGLSMQFIDVEELFPRCHFGDCRHDTEPSCAVKAALESGALTQARWQSYLKLQAEVRHSLRKQDKAVASQDRKAWKKRSADCRKHYRFRDS